MKKFLLSALLGMIAIGLAIWLVPWKRLVALLPAVGLGILGFLTVLAVVVVVLFVAVTLFKKRNSITAATTTPTTPPLKRKTGSVWLKWAVVVILVAIAANWGYQRGKDGPSTAKAVAPQPAAKPERTIEITAPVGDWSENVSIPLLHWFRIMPEGKIRIRQWNGKEMDSEPENDTWFGDNILDANFRFQSREEQAVKVRILLRPK